MELQRDEPSRPYRKVIPVAVIASVAMLGAIIPGVCLSDTTVENRLCNAITVTFYKDGGKTAVQDTIGIPGGLTIPYAERWALVSVKPQNTLGCPPRSSCGDFATPDAGQCGAGVACRITVSGDATGFGCGIGYVGP